MARVQAAPEDDPAAPDWFGEGTPFDTAAQLAAALPPAPVERSSLVTLPARTHESGDAEPEAEPEPEFATVFEILQSRTTVRQLQRATAPAAPQVPTWSVRVPGVEPLPQRVAGRSGWTLQNSIRILRRAEDMTLRLRHEAVIAAFDGASRAIRGEV